MKLVALLLLSVIAITYAAPNCTYYCNTIMANCNGTNSQYMDLNTCLAMCNAFPVGFDGETANNTLGCRVYHAEASLSIGTQHCAHAGPSGVDLASGNPICGTQCEAYCSLMTYPMGCNLTVRAFNTPAECNASCNIIPSDATKYFGNTSGNTLECRLYHAQAAYSSAGFAAHCLHAAPLGGGVCGIASDVFCDLSAGLCKGTDSQFLTVAYCKTLAPYFSNTTFYDYSGDSLACRAYHTVVGGATPSHCSHGGASGESSNGCGASICDTFCALSGKLCPSNYATTADCMTACGAWTSKLGKVSDTDGDSYYCRLYHLGAAASNAALHCPHALANSTTCVGTAPTPTPTPGPTPTPTPTPGPTPDPNTPAPTPGSSAILGFSVLLALFASLF